MATVAQALEAAQAEGWTEDQFAKALYDEFKIDLFATSPEFELPLDISAIPEKVIPTETPRHDVIPEADIAAEVQADIAQHLPKATLAERDQRQAEGKERIEPLEQPVTEKEKQLALMQMGSGSPAPMISGFTTPTDVVKPIVRVPGAIAGLGKGMGEFVGDVVLGIGDKLGVTDTSPGPESMLMKTGKGIQEHIKELVDQESTLGEYAIDDMQDLIGGIADIFRRTVFGETEPTEADAAEGLDWIGKQFMESTEITKELFPAIVMHINQVAQEAMDGKMETLETRPITSALVLLPVVKGLYRGAKATLPPETINKYNNSVLKVKNKILDNITPEFVQKRKTIKDIFDELTLEPSTETAAIGSKIERAGRSAEKDVVEYKGPEPELLPHAEKIIEKLERKQITSPETTKLVEEITAEFNKTGREIFPKEKRIGVEGEFYDTFFEEFATATADIIDSQLFGKLRFSPTVAKEYIKFIKGKGVTGIKEIAAWLKDLELPQTFIDDLPHIEAFKKSKFEKLLKDPNLKKDIVREALTVFLSKPLPRLEKAIRKKMFEDKAVEPVDLKNIQPVYKQTTEMLKQRLYKGEQTPPKSHVNPDPVVAEYLGIKASDFYIAPYLNQLLKWKARAQEMIRSEDIFTQVQQIMKGNLTARSIGSGINNMVANIFVQTLQEGTPSLLLERATKLQSKYEAYKSGKATPEDVVMFEAIEKTGILNATLVDVEFAALQGKALPLVKTVGIDFINKKSEAFYQFGDNFFKLERATKVFEILREYQSMLKEGEYIEIKLDKGKKVKIYKDTSAADLFAKAGRESANNILFDYRDLTLWENYLRSAPILGVASPFLTWAFKAVDIPFLKKGLVARLFDDVPSVNTNSRSINRKIASKNLRRAVDVGKYTSYALLNMREDKDRLRKILSYLDKKQQAMLIEETANPVFAKTMTLGSLDFTDPTVSIIRLLDYGYQVTFGDSLNDIKEITKEDPSLIWMMDDDGNVQPKYKKAYREAKARRDLFIRRKAGKIATWADALGLVGLDGGLLMDVIAKINSDEDVGGGLDAASFYNQVAPLLLSGNIAKLIKAGTGALDPTSYAYSLSMRQWADVPVDAEQETAIAHAIRMIIGKGWKIKGVQKNRRRYFRAMKKALKRGMLGRLKRVRQNFITAGNDDAADKMDERIDFLSELINETVLELQEEYLNYIDELEETGETE